MSKKLISMRLKRLTMARVKELQKIKGLEYQTQVFEEAVNFLWQCRNADWWLELPIPSCNTEKSLTIVKIWWGYRNKRLLRTVIHPKPLSDTPEITRKFEEEKEDTYKKN